MNISTVEEFEAALAEPYVWPGGYPRFFLMDDGDALSYAAAREEAEQIKWAIAEKVNNGWRVVGVDVNWEDPSLFCAHTGKRIESAYAEDEAVVLHGPDAPLLPPTGEPK